MSRVIVLKTKVSTFLTKKHTGYVHVGVNSPLEDRKEMNSTFKQVMDGRRFNLS